MLVLIDGNGDGLFVLVRFENDEGQVIDGEVCSIIYRCTKILIIIVGIVERGETQLVD